MSSGKVLFLWLKDLPHKCGEPPPCHLITYSASMYHCTQRWPKNIWPKKLAKLYLAPGLNFIKSDLEYKTNLFSSKCAFCMWLWLFYSPPLPNTWLQCEFCFCTHSKNSVCDRRISRIKWEVITSGRCDKVTP